MAVARETVRLGLAARGQAKLKVRQPLRAAVIVATGFEREAIERLADLVREELNVRELRFVSEADELGEVEVKPNYRTLGPALRQADAAGRRRGRRPRPGARRGGAARGPARRDHRSPAHDHELTADDLLVSMKPLEGYQVEREGSHAVALELEIDDELRDEGWAREIVHAVQAARRDAGLEVTDRIALTLDGDDALVGAARDARAATSRARRSRYAGQLRVARRRRAGRDRRARAAASRWRWPPR